MIEHEFPLIARLTLFALGTVEGGRIRSPLDPVAHWLMRHRPALVPSGGAAPALSTIRARSVLVDRLLVDEVHRANAHGDRLCLWTIGGGFDARWVRLEEELADVVVEIREVEDPTLLRYKDRWLRESPFAARWSQVRLRPKATDGWTARPRTGARTLVILEGPAGRLAPDALKRVLQRIRYETPDARVLLGLPGLPRREGDIWTAFRIRSLGFRVEEDINLGPRGRLMTPDGDELCPGMYPVRVLLLGGRAPGNGRS